MTESKKGHNFAIQGPTKKKNKKNIDPKPYAKYENPSSSGSQVIVLTRFLWPSRKRGITLPYKGRPKKKICVHLFFVLILHIKFQVPSSSRSLVLQPTTMLYR